MRWDAALPADLVDQLWRDPQALLSSGQTLQHKPRCTVVKLTHPAGEFLLKRHNWGGPIRTLKKSLRRPPAWQCWLDGCFLSDAGISTPRPRACVQRRAGPIGTTSHLLTDFIPGTTLYRQLRFTRLTEGTLRLLAEQVAAVWQQLNDLRVTHNDLKTENFQIDHQGRVWLIDLEKMRRHKSGDEIRQRQAIDLTRFFHPRNWRTNPAAAEVFRQHLLATRAGAILATSLKTTLHPLVTPRPVDNRPCQLVTAVIPTQNSAHTIGPCLESIVDFADEILIADAGSTDETLAIVRQHLGPIATGRCKILQHHFADEAEALQRAIERATHPWILQLLPDERVGPDLAKEIQDALASDPQVDGFRMTRRYYFWDNLTKLGGFRHDVPLRLVRREAAHFEMRDGQLELMARSQNIGRLNSQILFDACNNLDRHLADIAVRASRAAQERQIAGQHPNFSKAMWHGPWTFLRSYLLRGGWLNGWTGFHAAWLAALAVYLREAKLWESQQKVSAMHLAKPDRLPQLGIAAAAETTSDLLHDLQTIRFPQPQVVVVAADPENRRAAA